jgi:hypothetical protein
MNPDDMKSALGGIPMDHDVWRYGALPVALLVVFVLGIMFGNRRNAGHLFSAIGIFGWIWVAWSAVVTFGDKAIGELWADHLIVFFFVVPIVLAACVVAGLLKGLSVSLEEKRRSKR